MRASGFSTNTCFPASSARAAQSACVSWRVVTTTVSIAGSSSSVSGSVLARRNPARVPTVAADTPPLDASTSSEAPAAANAGMSTREAKFPAPIHPTTARPVAAGPARSRTVRRAPSSPNERDGYSSTTPRLGSLPDTTAYARSASAMANRWVTRGAGSTRPSAMRSSTAAKFRASVHRTNALG